MKDKNLTVCSRSYLDWEFDEDKLQNYKLVVDGARVRFAVGDKTVLKVFGRPSDEMKAKVLEVDDSSIVVHTEDELDIMEEYLILKKTV